MTLTPLASTLDAYLQGGEAEQPDAPGGRPPFALVDVDPYVCGWCGHSGDCAYPDGDETLRCKQCELALLVEDFARPN